MSGPVPSQAISIPYMVRIKGLDAKQFNAAEAVALFCYQIKKWIGTFHVRRWAAWTHFLRR